MELAFERHVSTRCKQASEKGGRKPGFGITLNLHRDRNSLLRPSLSAMVAPILAESRSSFA